MVTAKYFQHNGLGADPCLYEFEVRFFFLSVFILADGVELVRQVYVALFAWSYGFWGLDKIGLKSRTGASQS